VTPNTHEHRELQHGGMPTCRDVIEFLMAYVDDELSPAQRAAFEQHLAVCPSCVNYLNGYRSTISMANAAAPTVDQGELPQSLVAAVRAARRNS